MLEIIHMIAIKGSLLLILLWLTQMLIKIVHFDVVYGLLFSNQNKKLYYNFEMDRIYDEKFYNTFRKGF